MFTRISDFLSVWEFESGGTAKYFAELTDTSLSHGGAPDHRTVGRVAWHIVTTLPEMMNQTGLGLTFVNPEASVPLRADDIRRAYEGASQELVQSIKGKWGDALLADVDLMYGHEKWAKGLTLRILVDHQIHHRGQLSVLMRLAGLRVPGVYGPAKEEWSAMNMNPPAI